MDGMDEIASESVLHRAYVWLCERRQDYSPRDDVWDVRWRWEEILPQLQARLLEGTYRLGPVRRFHRGDETIEVWSALDALVLNATPGHTFGAGCSGQGAVFGNWGRDCACVPWDSSSGP